MAAVRRTDAEIKSVTFPDLKQSLALVRQLRVYAYDAYLLVCAMQLGTPLLTLDEPLRAAAAALGIEVMEI